MPVTEIGTTAGWNSVISDLTAKRQTMLDHLERLRQQKRELALEAAMGGAEARKKLAKVNAELSQTTLELDALESAGAEAESRREEAEQSEAETAEHQRQQRVTESLAAFAEAVNSIDDGLRALVSKFAKAKQHLDRAEVLMNGQERLPFQQVRSQWGATLAAAHCGLGDYISLGRESMHVGAHGKSLAEYVTPYLEPWLGATDGEE